VANLLAVFRIVIGSTLAPETAEHIRYAALVSGIDGFTVSGAYGWTRQWGVEDTIIIETAAPAHAVEIFVSILCNAAEQECAYVTINGGSAALWYDGRKEAL